ncbi:MAG: hypothetical protein K0Q67_1971 [Cellvibrio sp.]|jgi:hypothetical protein|nr:hypothetical protein [Cellvibrio sp.]
MLNLSVRLIASDGAGWEFTHMIADIFFVFLGSSYFSCCSSYLDHAINASKTQFTVYFSNACITLPVSELEKFEFFLRRVREARLVQ